MNAMNRRDFIKVSTSAAVLAAAGARADVEPVVPAAASLRPLGKTGIRTSLLGMGTGTRAWNHDSEQIRRGKQEFVDMLAHGYERGLRYFDLADMYGSHDYMRQAMKQAKMDRSQLMLLSKTVAKDAAGVKADLDRFRREADTDYFDVVLLHCMTEGPWQEKLAPCMDVLSEAKEKGIIRAHGVSCHNLDAMKTAADLPWVDVMLSRINPFQEKMDGTPDEVVAVLRRAHENGKGMLGMKIAGEGALVDRLDESLKFVLHLGCIDVITIGFLKIDEVDDTIARIDRALA